MAGIDERPEADAGQVARLAGGNVTEQVRDHALRQVVGLDPVRHGERLEFGHEPPVTADDAPHQAFVAEVVEASLLAVALARGVDERQSFRPADAVGSLFARFQKALLERDCDVLGKADADETGRGHRIAVANELHGFAGGHDLALLEALEALKQLATMLAHFHSSISCRYNALHTSSGSSDRLLVRRPGAALL